MSLWTRTPWPVVGFAAHSGIGKTTLVAEIISRLSQRGLRIGVIKHAHHSFDIDQPGKDSHRYRESGARGVVLGSTKRVAYVLERDGPERPTLLSLLDLLDPTDYDLILVEGFKREPFPKIELVRADCEEVGLYRRSGPRQLGLVAVATDMVDLDTGAATLLDLNDPDQIAAFILQQMSHWHIEFTRPHSDDRR